MLTLLIDAHQSMIALETEIQAAISQLHQHIQADIELFNSLYGKLSGVLEPFSTRTKTVKLKMAKSKRWHRMVQNVQDNSGIYCIELLKIE